MKLVMLILGCMLGIPAVADDQGKISLADIAERAVQQSKLTLPGSRPFHLQAEIIETTNPDSEYKGKVEQYWVSPEKWRRTIETPGFSQTLIVNGDQISENDTGDYFPWWLRDLVTAAINPLPLLDVLKHSNAQIATPRHSKNSNTCAYINTKIDRWTVCFEGEHGLLTSIFSRGYDAEFRDFQNFADKRVAHSILIDPESGTHIQERITVLTDLRQPDEALFVIPRITPPQERINAVQVDESTIRTLAQGDTDIVWPQVGGGPLTGRCAVYVSADRVGRIREAWPAGCDNAGLQDPLRDMVHRWQLKPATENGLPVQVEGLVTFAS